MLKRRSGGQELGELVSTAHNTNVNPGSVPEFDFHQSDKSNVSLHLLSFLGSSLDPLLVLPLFLPTPPSVCEGYVRGRG